MENKYIIEINTSSMPPNFNKWEKIDLVTELKNSYYNKDYLLLNYYKSVLIKSLNFDAIKFKLKNHIYEYENEYVCFMFLPFLDNFSLIINSTENLEVYVLDDYSEFKEIQNLFYNNLYFFSNNVIKNKNIIAMYAGMADILPSCRFNNLIQIDENKYYYELEQNEKKNVNFNKINFNKKICILDKYIQNDIIKICLEK